MKVEGLIIMTILSLLWLEFKLFLEVLYQEI